MTTPQAAIEQAFTTSTEIEAFPETTTKAQSQLEIDRENEQADALRMLTELVRRLQPSNLGRHQSPQRCRAASPEPTRCGRSWRRILLFTSDIWQNTTQSTALIDQHRFQHWLPHWPRRRRPALLRSDGMPLSPAGLHWENLGRLPPAG